MRNLLLHNSIQTRKNTNYRSFLQPKNSNYLQPGTDFKQTIVFVAHRGSCIPRKSTGKKLL